MQRNQRQFPRIKPKGMSCRVRVGGALHIGLAAENLSMGGAFVRCAQSPPLRTHATLELVVAGAAHPLVLPGKVAFVVPAGEAVAKKITPGFSIQFVEPLPPQAQKGLERLLGSLDPNALIPLVTEEPDADRTQSVSVPLEAEARGELAALRKLVASHERELERLRGENEQLRLTVKKLQLKAPR